MCRQRGQALKPACQGNATERCAETEHNTPDHVEQAEQPATILDERQALEAERRERGIAPEEAHSKKQPPVGMHEEALGDEYQEETNNKTSGDVNDQCAVGKAGTVALPDPICHEVAGICAQETAKANEEVVHAACL